MGGALTTLYFRKYNNIRNLRCQGIFLPDR